MKVWAGEDGVSPAEAASLVIQRELDHDRAIVSLRGCIRCAQRETLLEKVAIAHFNAVQIHEQTPDSDPQKHWTEQAVRVSRKALDVAQNLYNDHLEQAHARVYTAGSDL